MTVYHRGFHGDLNETLFVGKVSEEAKKLVQVTWECLEKAIEIGQSSNRSRKLGCGFFNFVYFSIVFCSSSETWSSLQGRRCSHSETRTEPRIFSRPQLLRPRNSSPLSHGSQRPSLH